MTDQLPTPQALRKALQAPDLRPLFTEELGWDNPNSGPLNEEVDGQPFAFVPIARKINFVVYRASLALDGKLPGRDTIRKLERKLEAKAAERLVIYSTASGDQTLWVRQKKEQGKAATLYTVEYKRGLRNEALLHYLKSLYITLDEDLQGLTTIDVARKASNIEVEKVTKKFYKEFDRIRKTFVGQISGVEGDDKDHYAGLTLNRLMFVYFIQKKEYLDGDVHYLRNRLKNVQAQRGAGKFQSFYRAFLLRLFHEGLGALPHDPTLTTLIGKVPYLNGGLFEEHRIEVENDAIEIPDAAFERVFAFFEGWRWTIDESAKAEADEAGKPEINPDVLGYIFEQYINNKQMGAYYTKEDITEYIGKNTILPFVLERAQEQYSVAFEGEHTIWDLLKENPDRYIHAAVRKGTEYELPKSIQAGLDPNQPDLLEVRKAWNKKADEEFALPTEIWREVVARRIRYFEVRGKLERGEVQSISALITLNLDIITFTQDVIRYAEGPELLSAIWKAVTTVTVLDPTCGSGAFLFAAAGILEPLYRLCLERMAEIVVALPEDDLISDFGKVLAEQAEHDQQYYILKQIIIRNLYGVDIMAEAVEIAKLRLFLKLMAFSRKDDRKPNLGLEPLPDIDFNIRTGNTLVGYTSQARAKEAVTSRLLSTSAVTWTQIEEKAKRIDHLGIRFRERQLQPGGQATSDDKIELRRHLSELEALLNEYLAADNGIDERKKPGSYQKWLESHQPFHWFIEFYNVMSRGGFDCIVGNPPYIETHKVKKYKVVDLKTSKSGNLYSMCMEVFTNLLNERGKIGTIIPLSGFSTGKMFPFREVVRENYRSMHLSFYSGDAHPSILFQGVKYRLAIFIGDKGQSGAVNIFTTNYRRWYASERHNLFDLISYEKNELLGDILMFAKLGDRKIAEITVAMTSAKTQMAQYLSDGGERFKYHRSPVFWIRTMNFDPYFKSPTKDASTDHVKDVYFRNQLEGGACCSIISSSLFFIWFSAQGNCRNLSENDLLSFPIMALSSNALSSLNSQFNILMDDMINNSKRRIYQYTSGTVEYDEFYLNKSKHIIDGIDQILSKHYSFTSDQLDYIINYDIKYRLGSEQSDEEVIELSHLFGESSTDWL